MTKVRDDERAAAGKALADAEGATKELKRMIEQEKHAQQVDISKRAKRALYIHNSALFIFAKERYKYLQQSHVTCSR